MLPNPAAFCCGCRTSRSLPNPEGSQAHPRGKRADEGIPRMTAFGWAGITSGMSDDLGTALNYHQRGLLNQAARIYQELLDRDPAHPDALHLLGAVALQQGQAARAADLISRAIGV